MSEVSAMEFLTSPRACAALHRAVLQWDELSQAVGNEQLASVLDAARYLVELGREEGNRLLQLLWPLLPVAAFDHVEERLKSAVSDAGQRWDADVAIGDLARLDAEDRAEEVAELRQLMSLIEEPLVKRWYAIDDMMRRNAAAQVVIAEFAPHVVERDLVQITTHVQQCLQQLPSGGDALLRATCGSLDLLLKILSAKEALDALERAIAERPLVSAVYEKLHTGTWPLVEASIAFHRVQSKPGLFVRKCLGSGPSHSVFEGTLDAGPFSSMPVTVMEIGIPSNNQAMMQLFADVVSRNVVLKHPYVEDTIGGYVTQRGKCCIVRVAYNRCLTDEVNKLDNARKLRLIIAICKGLIYLHSGSSPARGHGCLAPQNVFLDARDRPRLANPTTHRIIRRLHAGEAASDEPEALSADVEAADVFSLGQLLTWIFAGGDSVVESRSMPWWMAWEYPWATQVGMLPPILQEVVRGCCKEVPSERHGLSDVLRLLQAIDNNNTKRCSASQRQCSDVAAALLDSHCAAHTNQPTTPLLVSPNHCPAPANTLTERATEELLLANDATEARACDNMTSIAATEDVHLELLGLSSGESDDVDNYFAPEPVGCNDVVGIECAREEAVNAEAPEGVSGESGPGGEKRVAETESSGEPPVKTQKTEEPLPEGGPGRRGPESWKTAIDALLMQAFLVQPQSEQQVVERIFELHASVQRHFGNSRSAWAYLDERATAIAAPIVSQIVRDANELEVAEQLVRNGNFGSGVCMYREVLARWKQAFGPLSREVVDVSLALARALEGWGRWEEAMEHRSLALDFCIPTFGNDSEQVAEVRRGIAQNCVQRGDINAAVGSVFRCLPAYWNSDKLDTVLQSYMLWVSGTDSEHRAQLQSIAAGCFHYLSRSQMRQCLDRFIFLADNCPEHTDLVMSLCESVALLMPPSDRYEVLRDIGLYYFLHRHYFAKARRFLLSAVNSWRAAQSPATASILTALRALAEIYRQKSQYQNAIASYEEYLAIAPQVPTESPVAIFSSALVLLRLYCRENADSERFGRLVASPIFKYATCMQRLPLTLVESIEEVFKARRFSEVVAVLEANERLTQIADSCDVARKALFFLGRAKYKLKCYADAEHLLGQYLLRVSSVEDDHCVPIAGYTLGRIAMFNGQWSTARTLLAACKTVLHASCPQESVTARACIRLGEVCEKLCLDSEAVEAFSVGLSVLCRDKNASAVRETSARENLVTVLIRRKDLALAIPHLSLLVRFYSTSMDVVKVKALHAALRLAEVYFSLNRMGEADALLRDPAWEVPGRAPQLSASFKDALIRTATWHLQHGRVQEAIQALQRIPPPSDGASATDAQMQREIDTATAPIYTA